MKIRVNVLLNVLLSFTLALSAIANLHAKQINGKVICDENGIPSVMVTDGISVVETDSDGGYIFSSNSERGFFNYSLPRGYESPIQYGVPCILRGF
jgi:hypothetical protein